MNTHFTAVAALAAVTGVASAGEVLVTNDIATSTTWTADNTYNLQNQIFVLPGATLTIEAGTVIASTPTANGSGSLAVARGAQIFVNGTRENPVIMTSTNDVATWTAGDPKTGVWREAANEWGNLTIMGNAYISLSCPTENSATCGDNQSPMEGLIPGPNAIYGGTDDDDSSGSISFLSIRYGGRVLGLANELNGLSLGGLGRGTNIDHVEIMNNVDDGIEIWGGTVDLKYVNIWNVGDDSFDVDQGWRGRAQHGLIVQGYSLDASQGSGVGDNIFEIDGAEDGNARPVTQAAIYNFTVMGQPAPGAGDGGTAWRDNARVQYRKCIFMDLGERLVRFDDAADGCTTGYGGGPDGLSWLQTWSTPFDGGINCPEGSTGGQVDGMLAEISDSVFFNNQDPAAYTEAENVGVFNESMDNVLIPGFEPADQPIVFQERQIADADGDGLPGVTRGGKIMLRVLSLDPRAANEATSAANPMSADPFFDMTNYRGGFSPDENWLCNWSAADAFGFIVAPEGVCVDNAAPKCPTDLDNDGSTGASDLAALLAAWGPNEGDPADLDGDGTVGAADLAGLLAAWGACPK